MGHSSRERTWTFSANLHKTVPTVWVTQVVTGLELFPQIFTRQFQLWVTQVTGSLDLFSTILAGLIFLQPCGFGGATIKSALRVFLFLLKQNRRFLSCPKLDCEVWSWFSITNNSPQDCPDNFPTALGNLIELMGLLDLKTQFQSRVAPWINRTIWYNPVWGWFLLGCNALDSRLSHHKCDNDFRREVPYGLISATIST